MTSRKSEPPNSRQSPQPGTSRQSEVPSSQPRLAGSQPFKLLSQTQLLPGPSQQIPQGLELLSLNEILTARNPTITYVPKAARLEWSRLLADELTSHTA